MSGPSSKALAERIEALAAKATPGEWEPDNNDDRDCAQVILSSHFQFDIGDIFAGERPGECEANANLIVTLVNAVPEITAALRRIEALDAENARLRNVAKQAAEGWDNAIEMGLLPQRHHTTARIMRDEARAALKGSSDEG